MRTPEEFEPLALWMGWRKVKPLGRLEAWERPNRTLTHATDQKTSLTDAECIEALNRLVEKGEGYHYLIGGGEGRHSVSIAVPVEDGYREVVADQEDYPTIHEAVEQALLQIAAKGGGRE